MKYEQFIESKKHTTLNYGFEPLRITDHAFDFQKEIINRALIKGRVGVFADTGLGKTLIQITIADNIVRKTNKKVLILTPIAVAYQFIKEAFDRDITDDIEHCKNGNHSKSIVICNYERLHYFNPDDFECVILDESSILKNFKGEIKNQIMAFIRRVPYRFLSTATPSPNDFIELGNSSECLGHLGYMDMLGKFFKSNQASVDSNNRNIGEKFYLKPHAESAFFDWVNTWSIMVRKPSDLGAFSDDRYKLPALIKNTHTVENQSMIDIDGQVQLFTPIAKSFHEVRHEQKQTITQRCEKAIDLAEGKTSVYWCNLNEESALIKSMDDDCVEIIGSMSLDKKEEVLMAFQNQEIKRIVTKAKITGMGLNWQHCNHTVFFPTWSYEQYYQAIRRFWRFGQTQDVVCDLVVSDGQTRVLEALEQKTQKANELYTNLVNAVNGVYQADQKNYHHASLPRFI